MNCPYCGKDIPDSTQFCPECGQRVDQMVLQHDMSIDHSKTAEDEDENKKAELIAPENTNKNRVARAVICVLIVLVVGVIALSFFMKGGKKNIGGSEEALGKVVSQPETTEKAITIEATSNPVPSPADEPTPYIAPIPSPQETTTPLLTEGIGTNGAELTKIIYDSDGHILSLTERANGIVTEWKYCYDDTGFFMYRIHNIGGVPSHLSSKVMPGTDLNYSELEKPINNCVGFTIQYEVTTVRKGDGLGDRYLYIYDGSAWTLIGTFAYESYGRTNAEISLASPITIEYFTTPRFHADDSSFMIEQKLTDIWVADFSYVEVNTGTS